MDFVISLYVLSKFCSLSYIITSLNSFSSLVVTMKLNRLVLVNCHIEVPSNFNWTIPARSVIRKLCDVIT